MNKQIDVSQIAYSTSYKTDLSEFTVKPGGIFKEIMTENRLTASGLTTGEVSRQRIHEKLDEFLDLCLEKNNG